MKFANPTNDFAFKKIFGSAQHPNILISFLNAILDLPAPITAIELANPYQIPKIQELKDTILDIRAKDAKGIEFIVEMQVEREASFAKRSLYYTAKSYTSQLKKGMDYPKLNQVFFVGILDFSIFKTEDYLSHHLILDKKTFAHEIQDFAFTFIELPKFQKSLEELNSIADKWIYFIQHADDLDIIPDTFKTVPECAEAFEVAKQLIWTEEELELYEYKELKEQQRRSQLETAVLDGIEKGRIEGKKQGIKEGIEQGEKQKALAIARELKGLLPDEVVAQKTGLVLEEIQSL